MMQKFVLIVAVVLTATAIICIYAAELPKLAEQCLESDTEIFKACESAVSLKGLEECSDKYVKEEASAAVAELSEGCALLKEALTLDQLSEYFRRLKETLSPAQIQLMAQLGY